MKFPKLQKLIDKLQSLPNTVFNMANSCDSIGGWAKWMLIDDDVMKNINRISIEKAIMVLCDADVQDIELSLEFEQLCYPSYKLLILKGYSMITREVAIHQLNHFMQTGKCDWPLSLTSHIENV